MKIRQIRAVPIDIPRIPAIEIRSAYTPVGSARYVVVVVETDQGLLGLGEASPELEWTGEDLHSCFNCVVEYLAPGLIGYNPLHVQAAMDRMNSTIVANPHAKGAVEMALWDIVGKEAGLPCAELWGGRVRETVPIKFVCSGPPARAAEIAQEYVNAGFRYLKLKTGSKPEEDIAKVQAVRNAVGAEIPFGVDANMGWTPLEAQALLPALEEAGVTFIEQPFHRSLTAALLDFRRQSSIPVVAHESLFTLDDARELLRSRTADIWAVTPGTHGGYIPTRDILSLARAGHIPCLLGSTTELGIGSAFMAHIGLCSPGIDGTVPSDIIGSYYHAEDIIVEKMRFEDGGIAPPDGPGLGVTLNEVVIAKYRVDL